MTFNYDSINQLDENEKLWLLGDVASELCNPNAEKTDECIKAIKAIEKIDNIERLRLIYGITVIKFNSPDSPTDPEKITNYSDCPIAFECAETWGDFLEKLDFNDATWMIYCLTYDPRDYSEYKHYEILETLGDINEELDESKLKLRACQLAFSIGTNLYKRRKTFLISSKLRKITEFMKNFSIGEFLRRKRKN